MVDRLAQGVERAGADVAEHHADRADRQGPEAAVFGDLPAGAWDSGPVAWVDLFGGFDAAGRAPASWGVSPAMRILRVVDDRSSPSKRRAFRLIPRPLQSRARDSVSPDGRRFVIRRANAYFPFRNTIMSDSQRFPVAAHALAYMATRERFRLTARAQRRSGLLHTDQSCCGAPGDGPAGQAGLIATRPGATGGSWLLRQPQDIRLDEVLKPSTVAPTSARRHPAPRAARSANISRARWPRP